MLREEGLPISVHPQPVVSDPMQQNDSVPIDLLGPQEPGAQPDTVSSGDSNVLEVNRIRSNRFFHLFLFAGKNRANRRMQRNPSHPDAKHNLTHETEDDEDNEDGSKKRLIPDVRRT